MQLTQQVRIPADLQSWLRPWPYSLMGTHPTRCWITTACHTEQKLNCTRTPGLAPYSAAHPDFSGEPNAFRNRLASLGLDEKISFKWQLPFKLPRMALKYLCI